MAYTRAWSDVTPAGSDAANTIDDAIRNLRVDIHDRLNSMVADWTVDPIVRFGCRVFASANQTIANATNARLAFNSETFDTATLHDTAVNNSRITIPANGNKGIWLFHACVLWNPNITGTRLVEIWKNGAVIAQNASSPASNNPFTMDFSVLVNTPSVADFFEVNVFQTSGGNLDVAPGSGGANTYFEAIQLL